MGINSAIEDGLLLVTAEGEYGLRDVQEALDAAIASPGFEAPMCLCADATRDEDGEQVERREDPAIVR